MSKPSNTKTIDTIVDIAIILFVSLILFYTLTSFGLPLWLALVCVGIWGAFTGYRPQFIRKTFSFFYKQEK
ncbi:MAG: hypothetical protein IBX44_00155 [Sulfurospirillum sp.]|nr:hypothetical protein [Sulfurospirillum sp.]